MLDLVDAEDALSYTSADSPKGYSNSSGEHGGGQTWEVVRAAIRYVTQKPWNRIPPITRTLIYNPVLSAWPAAATRRAAAVARAPCTSMRPARPEAARSSLIDPDGAAHQPACQEWRHVPHVC